MQEKLISKILRKIENVSFNELDAKLTLHEVSYLSNYLQNVMIELYLAGKIKECPIEKEIEFDKKFDVLRYWDARE